VPLPTPPGPIKTKTEESATKGPEEFGALLGSKSAYATRLSNRGILHDAASLDFSNGRECTYEVECAHLSDTLFVLGQAKQCLERELAGLDEALDIGTSAAIGDGKLRRSNALFLAQARRRR